MRAKASASVEVRVAFDQLQAGPPGCPETLQKILLNILRNPTEAKYRKVRLGNPRIQATVVEVDGGLELLQVRERQMAASNLHECDIRIWSQYSAAISAT